MKSLPFSISINNNKKHKKFKFEVNLISLTFDLNQLSLYEDKKNNL